MTRTGADNWSIARSLAFLAAVFAIVFGSLAPSAALAAARSGVPLIICSAAGPQRVSIDELGNPTDDQSAPGAKCAACLLAVAAELPQPPLLVKGAARTTRPAAGFRAAPNSILPPARAPPRPPSTAPPTA